MSSTSSSRMRLLLPIIFLFVLLLFIPFTSSASPPRVPRPSPRHIRVDGRLLSTHPNLVIDTHRPTFDWQLESELHPLTLTPIRNLTQLAYQLRITSPRLTFDSHKTFTPHSHHITYTGPHLQSDTTYTFHLQYWSSSGRVSEIVTGRFRTALFAPGDWHGQWIGSDAINMNQLRYQFNVTSPVNRATIFYSGIGYSDLYLNSRKVDPTRHLDPGWTQYSRRTLYVSFDLTHQLSVGLNALGVELGDGWYSRQPGLYVQQQTIPANVTYGPPRLLVQLNVEYEGGEQVEWVSNGEWVGRAGSVVGSGVYQGSIRDMRTERQGWSDVGFIDPYYKWVNATIMPSPLGWGGVLTLQPMDPIRVGADSLVVRTKSGGRGHVGATIGVPITQTVLHPTSNTQWQYGNVFDLGQNMVGWCTINVTLPRGSSLYIRYSEYKLQPVTDTLEGPATTWSIDQSNLHNTAVEDVYIANGTGSWELLEPRFTYRGFRYVWIGSNEVYEASAVACPVVHSEAELVGNFTSSSPVINQLQQNILWSQLGNTMSLMTDCPQRNERRGWLGDASGSADLSMFNFNLAPLYRHFVDLIADDQYPNGGVPITIPNSYNGGTNPSADPNWATAYTWIPWMLYQHYGDTTTMSKHWQGMERLFLFVYNGWYQQHQLKGMIVQFGDWAVQPDGATDNALVTSYAFLRDCYTLMQMAKVLGMSDREKFYNQTYTILAQEFHTTWYNATQGGYSNNAQTANTLALALPLVTPASLRSTVAGSLVHDIQERGHMTCGIIGAANLFPVLSDTGHHDVAVGLITSVNYPSYGWTFNNRYENATTVWERFSAGHDGGDASHNHHMFSPVGSWFYRYLLGVELSGGEVVRVWPRLRHDHERLGWVKGEMETVKGRVEVEWEVRGKEKGLMLNVVMPVGVQARVKAEVPVKGKKWEELSLNGVGLIGGDAERGVYGEDMLIWSGDEEGAVEVEVGSGGYEFIGRWS